MTTCINVNSDVSPLNVGVIVLQFVVVASPLSQDLLYVDTWEETELISCHTECVCVCLN